MAKRKTLGPKRRFELFKRDRFTCQYCGRTPPAVVLVLDHVEPVAKDGETEDGNLITACEECNSGKGAVSLDAIPPTLADAMKRRREMATQMEEYNQFLMDERTAGRQAAERVSAYWFKTINRTDRVFNEDCLRSIHGFLETLAEAELLKAVDITLSKKGHGLEQTGEAFRYFCGICHNWIRERVRK